jgi:hypothetical protein
MGIHVSCRDPFDLDSAVTTDVSNSDDTYASTDD